MAFKLFVLSVLVAVASAQHYGSYHAAAPVYHAAAPVYHAAPAIVKAPVYHAAPVYKQVYAEPEAPAHYSFEYAVHDEHTGDIKEQKESRDGDNVQGYYTLKEADGTRRIVHYTADEHNGFNAVVSHEGQAVAYKAAPVYAAAPVAYKTVAPVYKAAAPAYHHY